MRNLLLIIAVLFTGCSFEWNPEVPVEMTGTYQGELRLVEDGCNGGLMDKTIDTLVIIHDIDYLDAWVYNMDYDTTRDGDIISGRRLNSDNITTSFFDIAPIDDGVALMNWGISNNTCSSYYQGEISRE